MNKKVIDPVAPRFVAVLTDKLQVVTIYNNSSAGSSFG
jgi:hypothetical protein